MKTLLSILVAVALLGTGCIRTSKMTPEQKVTVERVTAVLTASAASTVLVIVAKNPETKGWFQAANAAICNLSSGEQMDPAAIQKAILSTGDNPPLVFSIGMNLVLGVYEAAWADRVNADVAENAYAHAILLALCEGIKRGAGVPTP